MRLIPKRTKLQNTIWKSYTIWDLLVMAVFFAAVILIAMSNIPLKIKIAICLVWGVIGIVMFFPFNEDLLYKSFIRLVNFIFSNKVFKKLSDKKSTIDMLIPYRDIEEDGTIKYPGYLGAVIEIQSKNFGLLDSVEQDINIEDFALALKNIDPSRGCDLVKIDRPIILDEWEDELLRKIENTKEDDLIRKNILISRHMQISDLNTEKPLYRPFYYMVVYANNARDLNEITSNVEYCLEMAGLNPKILDDKKDVAIFLKYCNTRHFDEREIDSLDESEYLDWIKPEMIKIKSECYTIDDINAVNLAISDYPVEVGNAWGADLFNIDNTKVVMHIKGVEQGLAIKRIDKAVNELLSREDSLHKASEVLNQETHVQTMKELLVSLQNSNEHLYDVSLTVTGFANNKENIYQLKKSLRREIQNKGFKVNNLIHLQLDAIINSNISQQSSLKFLERGINSTSLAAVFPFVFSSIIEENGILIGYNNYPVIIDIWKRGDDYQNSNGMIVGTSGSGKSYFLKTALVNLYSDHCNIFILDPENEYNILCNNLGGDMIDAGTATHGMINPFHIYQILTEEGTDASPEVVYSSHLRTLESFFRIIFEGATSEVLETINNAVTLMYKKHEITEETDVSKFPADKFPIFEDLLAELKTQEKEEKSTVYKGNIQRAITYVVKFTKGGRYAALWNGKSTLETNSDFTVFNFQSLFSNKNHIVANAQMLLIFRFLEQEIINRREKNIFNKETEHTMIVADEAHLFIDPKFPIALEFFYQMTKRIRKYGGSFIPATQSISDWNATEELSSKTTAILKESQYNFILKLKPNGVEDLAELYRAGSGINDSEKRAIVKAKTGGMFFIGNDKQHSFFQVVASEYVESLFSTRNAEIDVFTRVLEEIEESQSEEEAEKVRFEETIQDNTKEKEDLRDFVCREFDNRSEDESEEKIMREIDQEER